MSLNSAQFSAVRMAWEEQIARLGREGVLNPISGPNVDPIVFGLAIPREQDVINAYGETARRVTLRQKDLGATVPVKFDVIEYLGAKYVLEEIHEVWLNDTVIGYRGIARG